MGIWFAAPADNWPHYTPRAFSITSVTNADSNFPAANLLTYDPTQVFRTTSGSTVITVSVGAGQGFDVIGLLYTNASYRATWTVEISNDNISYVALVTGVPLWASLTGAQPSSLPFPLAESNDPRYNSIKRNHALTYSPYAASDMRYVRMTISDPLVTNLTFGRFFLGRKWVPTYGWQYGSSFNFTDYGRAERTEKGVLILEPSKSIVSVTVKMDFLTRTEMYDFTYNFNQFLGASREFLACLDDVDTARLQKNLLYCTIAEGRMISIEAYNINSQSWILESIA